MKIDRSQLADALLQVTLDQFRNVPEECELHHEFSHRFQESISRISRKSEGVLLGVRSVPVRKLVVIAVLVAVMFATLACAMPAIRRAILKFFVMDHGTHYGIVFDPSEVGNTPGRIENVYVPSFQPEGYTLTHQKYTSVAVDLLWINGNREYIQYTQTAVQKDAEEGRWIGIDAEETERTTRDIDGYPVEIVTNPENQQYVAVWTDDQYIFTVDISVASSDPEQILRSLISSMVELPE